MSKHVPVHTVSSYRLSWQEALKVAALSFFSETSDTSYCTTWCLNPKDHKAKIRFLTVGGSVGSEVKFQPVTVVMIQWLIRPYGLL